MLDSHCPKNEIYGVKCGLSAVSKGAELNDAKLLPMISGVSLVATILEQCCPLSGKIIQYDPIHRVYRYKKSYYLFMTMWLRRGHIVQYDPNRGATSYTLKEVLLPLYYKVVSFLGQYTVQFFFCNDYINTYAIRIFGECILID